ncbi:glycosyl hydrolase 115 family protein [Christiangramia crocea]|uniref:Glycosyl hydrolase 115 family protein n=1 Tax=Christiangramia crocea TaxID=2904124 RepID=A0A9X2A6J1_9FLAO|nr:glycosyl hydrolase 115 family protein [Gramella crocea]MCG9970023.1 glycosyl hydrolase 115 family protein [Gramella crocea]
MNRKVIFFILLYSSFSGIGQESKKEFEIAGKDEISSIIYDENGSSLDSISAYLFAEDILKITNKKPEVSTSIGKDQVNYILIGELESPMITKFLDPNAVSEEFKNQKESFLYKVINQGNKKILIIAGTDPRGTAFGVFNLSEKLGVSPWNWWADVPVQKQQEIFVESTDFYSKEPSVEYRGIFLNDEDWGLQPWAEHTFEPEVGDIGPKTYSKIFELLLRLKANTIWPAMHPSTRAFFHYPGNPDMASKYHIVLGSSHAEPMLRNNVDEWKHNTMGDFSYVSNEENVYNYWEERVKESSQLDAIYTIGMRGVHDSGMEGVKSVEQAAQVLSGVIKDQRKLLEQYSSEPISEIPQAFTVYKEVLDLYDSGMDIPDDITIIWTDDNYGYIRRLSDENERQRAGGGGVYYHASYWGRPHDYLWLSSTHPGLIREEMMKAYKTGDKKIWILNVGDIKPAEYNMQLFMDMAYDVSRFEDPQYVDKHLESFYKSVFDGNFAKEIADLKTNYYQLAFERKPEFMGWSQTEPTTSIDTTAYSPFSWGDEVTARINEYDTLEKKVEEIQQKLPEKYQDAFFQLVYYPVKGASFMNKKFLFRDLAIKYNQEKRLEAQNYKELSLQYYDSIVALTERYNEDIAEGKWQDMMDMQPRGLPVYLKPEIKLNNSEVSDDELGISVEHSGKSKKSQLPIFYQGAKDSYFFDLFIKAAKSIDWQIGNKPDWLLLTKSQGSLDSANPSERIKVSIDWEKWKESGAPRYSELSINSSKTIRLTIEIHSYNINGNSKNTFIEKNGIVSIYAENYSDKRDSGEFGWEKMAGLSYSKNLMQSLPLNENPLDTFQIAEKNPYLEYDIYTETLAEDAELIVNALPTHPLTNNHSLRIGVQWDDNPVKIIDFKTYGRSEEWKQNVLRNLAKKNINVNIGKKGKHTLRIYMIDEGVAIDFIYLNLLDQSLPYSILPETKP